VPDLIDTQITTLQDCLDRADVVLQVVDARDIAGCRNKWVEGLVSDAGGKFGLIINKVDLVPREVLESWLPHLPEYTFLFKSFLPTTNIPASSSSKTQLPHNPEQCLGKDELLAAFAAWSAEIQAKKKDKEEPVVISLFGLPNVGKTSVLNSLLGHAKGKYAVAPVVPLASQAKDLGTTTRMPVEVAVTGAEGVKVHVIDTPGWEPAPEDMDEEEEEDEDEDGELTEAQVAKFDRMEATLAGDLLRRNMGRIDKIKDVFPLGMSLQALKECRKYGGADPSSQLCHFSVQPSRPDAGLQCPLLYSG
jgi:nuclear GTP-binding protein